MIFGDSAAPDAVDELTAAVAAAERSFAPATAAAAAAMAASWAAEEDKGDVRVADRGAAAPAGVINPSI